MHSGGMKATTAARDTGMVSPFPVAPADVPPDAVRFVKRTLLRNSSSTPFDDELARIIVAGVIAVLAGQAPPVRVPPPRRRGRTPAATADMTALF